MNTQKVRNIIELYKLRFQHIHNEEIYKWEAVQCFQNHWNIEASDFLSMLDASLSLAKNLMDSGLYYPKRMIHNIAEKEPETVRELFRSLYDESKDLRLRITSFREKIKEMNKVLFPGKNDYQDHRAILVYLSMKYPDKYYLYKFGMFEEFVKLVDYPSKPIAGRVDNVIHFIKLCNHLKAEILLDEELLEQHLARLTEKDYPDTEYNILTQDIIYAAVEHLDIFDQPQEQESAFIRLKKVFKKVVAKSDRVSLKGHKSDHEETEKEKRRIGYLGELLVLQHEQTSLLDKGISKVPIHKSITEGDGLGYDILSYNSKGEEIYIEVKTTKYDADTPFYITANELEKSKEVGNRFCLYRLYFFDDMNNCAVYYDRSGDLTDLCINPILYKVVVESTDEG